MVGLVKGKCGINWDYFEGKGFLERESTKGFGNVDFGVILVGVVG